MSKLKMARETIKTLRVQSRVKTGGISLALPCHILHDMQSSGTSATTGTVPASNDCANSVANPDSVVCTQMPSPQRLA